MSDEYRIMKVESDGTRIGARAYMISQDDKVIKAAVIVGPEQTCVGIFANLVQEGSLVYVDGMNVTKCEFRYRRMVHHLPCKWVAMCILSKDPRCLWTDSDLGLINGIKRSTETPFLDNWIGWMRKNMLEYKYLAKLTGHNPLGSIINASTELMDELVIQGIRNKSLKLEGV